MRLRTAMAGLSVLAGCAADATNGTLSGSTQSGSEVEGLISGALEAELDRLVGQFADGRTPVWTGTASASDATADGTGMPLTVRESFPNGPAIAWTVRGTLHELELRIAQLDVKKRISVSATANAGQATLGLVLDLGTSGGHQFACPSCPSPHTLGDQLTIDAVGERSSTSGEAPWRSELDAVLTRVPAADVRWDDVVAIHQFERADSDVLAQFSSRGARLERRLDTEFRRMVPPDSAHAGQSCTETTPYEALQWIDPATLEVGFELESVGASTVRCWSGEGS